MESDNISWIGTRDVWGVKTPVGLHISDRSQHVWITGQTGTGKSTLLRNLMVQDLEAGRGFALIDPHGNLAANLLEDIPSWRTDHVVYFNAADSEYPIPLNVLKPQKNQNLHLVSSEIANALRSIWGGSWGERMQYILLNTLASLAQCDNVSLLGVNRMLSDPIYRRWVVSQLRDPHLRNYWNYEFETYSKQQQREAVSPIQNKVGQLLIAPCARNVLGQVRNKVDFRFMMDTKRILIVNLAKGLIGEQPARLLGSLIVTQFQLAALSRADSPEGTLPPFNLYIDEFQNFTTLSFVSMLSEVRKYGLNLTLANQFTRQIEDPIRDALFGNVGTTICFRLGVDDAELFAKHFGDEIVTSDLVELDNFEVCVKAVSQGHAVRPHRLRTSAPLPVCHHAGENLIQRSREKYAVNREMVENKFERWIKGFL